MTMPHSSEISPPEAPGAPTIRPADEAWLDRAVELLHAGKLVAFPTETVYGLGADATNDEAVAGIFAAKGRPRFNPLIVHFAAAAHIERAVAAWPTAWRLAEGFWPGPLTLVLPRRTACPVSLLCSAGLDSLAVRVPGHPVALRLLEKAGLPIAAPSANRAGRLSPTTAAHVAGSLGPRVSLILDGGACPVGLESTVVDLTGERPRLLRPGGITLEALNAALPARLRIDEQNVEVGASMHDAASPARSPGLLTSHYAPRLPLRLEAREVADDEALLAFGPNPPPGAAVTRNLSPNGDPREAAAHLFQYLRELDRPGLRAIAAMPIPEQGLGRAINDRLRRAAAPRLLD